LMRIRLHIWCGSGSGFPNEAKPSRSGSAILPPRHFSIKRKTLIPLSCVPACVLSNIQPDTTGVEWQATTVYVKTRVYSSTSTPLPPSQPPSPLYTPNTISGESCLERRKFNLYPRRQQFFRWLCLTSQGQGRTVRKLTTWPKASSTYDLERQVGILLLKGEQNGFHKWKTAANPVFPRNIT